MTDVLRELQLDLINLVAKIERYSKKVEDNEQLESLALASGFVASAALEVGCAVEQGRRIQKVGV